MWRGKYKRIERIEFKGLEKIIKIGKLRCGEAIKFEFEFIGLEMIKMGKLRCGEAIKFEFELKRVRNELNWEIEVWGDNKV